VLSLFAPVQVKDGATPLEISVVIVVNARCNLPRSFHQQPEGHPHLPDHNASGGGLVDVKTTLAAFVTLGNWDFQDTFACDCKASTGQQLLKLT
jgi:hypothetical protein